jgi:DNA-binding PadR family transcriptional regulator
MSSEAATPEQLILAALETGDKAGGDLLDASGLKSYIRLNPLLDSLTRRGIITLHWAESGNKVYRLAQSVINPKK